MQSILDNLPSFIDAAINMVLALVQGILNTLPKLLEQAPVIVKCLCDSIITSIPLLIDSAVKLIEGISTFIINNLDKIVQTAVEVVLALIAGLLQAIPKLMEATPKLVNAIIGVFKNTNWGEVGLNLVKGIATGIANGVGSVVQAAKDMANSVWNSITGAFDMHSPSRLAIRVFQKDFVEKGIGQGILKGIPEVVRNTKQMSESIVGAMRAIPSMALKTQLQDVSSKTVGMSDTLASTTSHYEDGDIIIQTMNINSKENAQYFAEYLYTLKKSRNRTLGVMT